MYKAAHSKKGKKDTYKEISNIFYCLIKKKKRVEECLSRKGEHVSLNLS